MVSHCGGYQRPLRNIVACRRETRYQCSGSPAISPAAIRDLWKEVSADVRLQRMQPAHAADRVPAGGACQAWAARCATRASTLLVASQARFWF